MSSYILNSNNPAHQAFLRQNFLQGQGTPISNPQRDGCRVRGCTQNHTSHICAKCGDRNSDHFGSDCKKPSYHVKFADTRRDSKRSDPRPPYRSRTHSNSGTDSLHQLVDMGGELVAVASPRHHHTGGRPVVMPHYPSHAGGGLIAVASPRHPYMGSRPVVMPIHPSRVGGGLVVMPHYPSHMDGHQLFRM